MDIIDDGINGILFEKDTPEGLEQAIARLLDDTGSYRELGRNARLKVEEELNWRANARVVTTWITEKLLNL
jgi:glycosyltransferase involved in cell wall biosynthesis